MSVYFNEEKNEVYMITNNQEESRSLGSEYFRGLITNCEDSEREIVKIINENCKNQIILVQDTALTVRDLDKEWCNDDTVILFMNRLKYDDSFKSNFCKLFDMEVNKKIKSMALNYFEMRFQNIIFKFSKVLKL